MIIYFLIGVPVFIVLLTVTGRLEKRMVWPYGTPEAQPQFRDGSGYATQRVGEALEAGFSFFGWSADLKGPRYQISYGLMASPERDCFAVIGVGKVLSVRIRGTWIFTRATDGKVIYTTDNQACVEVDASRRWRGQLVRARTFTELLQRHRALLRDYAVMVQPFAVGREIDEFRTIREEHHHAMSREGLIVFTDGAAVHWRYTFWGALKFAALSYSIGLVRALTFGRIPRVA